MVSGLWFLVFGHQYDDYYVQQMVLSLGHFLVPLLVAYLLISFSQDCHEKKVKTLGYFVLVCFIVLGCFGYTNSSVQPSVI